MHVYAATECPAWLSVAKGLEPFEGKRVGFIIWSRTLRLNVLLQEYPLVPDVGEP